MGSVRRRSGGVLEVRGGGVRVRRLPQRDCRGMRKREMVGKESRALLDGAGWEGLAEVVDDARSVVRRTESSGT